MRGLGTGLFCACPPSRSMQEDRRPTRQRSDSETRPRQRHRAPRCRCNQCLLISWRFSVSLGDWSRASCMKEQTLHSHKCGAGSTWPGKHNKQMYPKQASPWPPWLYCRCWLEHPHGLCSGVGWGSGRGSPTGRAPLVWGPPAPPGCGQTRSGACIHRAPGFPSFSIWILSGIAG